MPQLTVYCCPLAGVTSGTRILSRGECLDPAPGLEVTDGAVTLRLQPVRSSRGEVLVRLLPLYETEYCDAGTPSLRFGRALRKSQTGAEEILLDELALILKHPDHCRWLATTAQASGPQEGDPRRIGSILIPVEPEGDLRARPVLPAANGRSLVRLKGAEAVPGDLLSLVWDFAGPEVAVARTHDGGWLETPCLRGGRVMEVAGEEGSEDRRYLVQGHGGWAVCAASDHVPYAVGDWVFYSQVSAQCTRCTWWESFMTVDVNTMRGGSHVEPEEQPRSSLQASQHPEAVILPLVCGGFQSESPAFEAFAMPEVSGCAMGDVLDFCLRKGVVIEADADGALSVELPWGREDGLPVHYHCPNTPTVAGGHTAFQPDDAVLVVSSREQQLAHAVIGFADRLPRPCKEYVVLSTGLPERGGRTFHLVWDVLAGAPAGDLLDGQGGLLSPNVFPCTREVIQPWLDQSRAVTIQDQMTNLLAAERPGFTDTVAERHDSHPSPGRQCADLACQPPDDCPWYNLYVDGELLGGHCGSCRTEDRRDNAWSGRDEASFSMETTHQLVDEEGHLHERRTWQETHPFLRCDRQAAAPHPATSLRCVWGGFEDVIQVSRRYSAWRELRFATDLSENSLEFEETVTDRIAFPGISHRAAFEWTDTTRALRPAAEDGEGFTGTRGWTWNDRTVTVNGFGLRTQRSWLFAYVLVTKRWRMEPYVSEGKQLAPGFDIAVAAGAGNVPDRPLSTSPFTLPTDSALETALTALVQAAFDDATFTTSAIHAENTFTWEVRA